MKDTVLETRFTNSEILEEVLANSMEFHDEDTFSNLCDDLGVVNPEEVYEKYWSLDALDRASVVFDWLTWIEENVEFNQ